RSVAGRTGLEPPGAWKDARSLSWLSITVARLRDSPSLRDSHLRRCDGNHKRVDFVRFERTNSHHIATKASWASWTYTRSSFAAVPAGRCRTAGSSRAEMPVKRHTRCPGSICTAKGNAGRFGYASGGLETEAHRRGCFTPA